MTAAQVLARQQPAQWEWATQVARALTAVPDAASSPATPQVQALLLAAVDADPARRPNACELLRGLEGAVASAGGGGGHARCLLLRLTGWWGRLRTAPGTGPWRGQT